MLTNMGFFKTSQVGASVKHIENIPYFILLCFFHLALNILCLFQQISRTLLVNFGNFESRVHFINLPPET